jgi:inhibitor of KinA
LNNHCTIFPLGDSAATIELGKTMSEAVNNQVLAMQQCFNQNAFAGLKDILVAYNSLTLIYDPYVVAKHYLIKDTVFGWIQKQLAQAFRESTVHHDTKGKINRIPVCYDEEFGVDLPAVRETTTLSSEEIIELHVSKIYRVYMLGFLPGFAYLGQTAPGLAMPRKESPVPVLAGSVGIVSSQTGIYPLNSPGGWQVIGRTPVKLFEAKDPIPVKLKAGDEVQFYKITREEFEGMSGQ